MRIKTNLFPQPGPFHMDSCQIEKLIELSAGDFAALTANPLRDWPCIAENRNWMFIANGTTHCVLALGKGYLSLMVQYLKAIVFDSCGRSPL